MTERVGRSPPLCAVDGRLLTRQRGVGWGTRSLDLAGLSLDFNQTLRGCAGVMLVCRGDAWGPGRGFWSDLQKLTINKIASWAGSGEGGGQLNPLFQADRIMHDTAVSDGPAPVIPHHLLGG